jgi:hypothetical protein
MPPSPAGRRGALPAESLITLPLAVVDAGALAAWCGLVRCGQELHLGGAAAPRAVVTDVLALIADRHTGSAHAAMVDIFDVQRAPVTWFDDLPLAAEGLRWSERLDCTIATGLAIALALREGLPLVSFDGRLTTVEQLTFLRLPRQTQ